MENKFLSALFIYKKRKEMVISMAQKRKLTEEMVQRNKEKYFFMEKI